MSYAERVGPFAETLRRVKLLVLDVDGVLTDGRLFYGPKGELLKAFHVRDGHGIKQVSGAGVTVAADDRLSLATRLMAKHRTSHLVVIQPHTGNPVGVLSALDLAGVLAFGESA